MQIQETGLRWLWFLLMMFTCGYLALSYPQFGTSIRDALLSAAFGVTLLLWLFDRQAFHKYSIRLKLDPITWGVAFLVVWGLLATIVTGLSSQDFRGQFDIYRKVMIKGGMAYLAITYFCFRRRSASLVFTILAVVGFFACMDVLVSYGLGYFDANNRDAVKTLLHTRIHVNLISRKLNFVVPFFVAFMWSSFSWTEIKKYLIYGSGVLGLVASFLTISRAGWLGGTSGLFFLFLYARARKTLVVGVAICVLAFLIVYASSKDVRRHIEVLNERLPTLSERLPNWELCLQAIGERPVWGWGVYEEVTFHRMVRAVDGENSKILKYPYPHNVFLELPLMWGTAFFAGVILLFVYIYWKGWVTARTADLKYRFQWAALAGATIGAFWVNGFFSRLVWPDVFIALGIASALRASPPLVHKTCTEASESQSELRTS